MLNRYLTVGAAIAASFLATSAATAFTASNSMRVNPVTNAVFEVIARGSARTGDYWCAAAEFLLYNGVSGATQRIYVVRALGQAETMNRRSAVHFSINPPQGVDTTPGHSLTVKRVGENVSASLARSQCYNREPWLIP